MSYDSNINVYVYKCLTSLLMMVQDMCSFTLRKFAKLKISLDNTSVFNLNPVVLILCDEGVPMNTRKRLISFHPLV